MPDDRDGTVRADQLYSLSAHRPPHCPPDIDLDPVTPITTTLDDPPGETRFGTVGGQVQATMRSPR